MPSTSMPRPTTSVATSTVISPAPEPAHHAVAGGLGQIAVDGGHPGDHPAQPLGQPVGPALGAGEDDALPRPVALEQLDQQVELPIRVHRDVELLDRLDRRLVARQVDLDRLEHVALGQLAHVGVDRGREQQGLAGRGELAEDPLDVGPEPDVEHPIGLVEHDVDDVARDRASAARYGRARGRACRRRGRRPGGGPGSAARSARRRTSRRWRSDRPMASFWSSTDDLLDQLAGRGQDDGLGAAASRLEHLDQRDAERRGLARARLGLADDVEAIERLGDEGRLNGGGREVAGVLEGPEHGRAQVHGQEPDRGLLFNSSNQSILQEYRILSRDIWPTERLAARAKLAWADNGDGSEPWSSSSRPGRSQNRAPGRTACRRFDPPGRDRREGRDSGIP